MIVIYCSAFSLRFFFIRYRLYGLNRIEMRLAVRVPYAPPGKMIERSSFFCLYARGVERCSITIDAWQSQCASPPTTKPGSLLTISHRHITHSNRRLPSLHQYKKSGLPANTFLNAKNKKPGGRTMHIYDMHRRRIKLLNSEEQFYRQPRPKLPPPKRDISKRRLLQLQLSGVSGLWRWSSLT